MRFRYTILYVADVAQTMEFYLRAFGFKPQMVDPTGSFGMLDTGGVSLSFCSLDLLKTLGKTPSRPDPKQPCFEVAFETDDVAGALKRALEAGAQLVQPVKAEEWGQTTSYVHDPNGFLIEICSPVATG